MTAFYLKYRPQKIADLDLEKVRDELGKILASGKVPHAFLFVGPKGTGKTSSARIVAKAVNCIGKRKKSAKKGEPCNKCETCKAIMRGREMDLIEIDAASNRGIDDIRELKEKIGLAPSKALKKVYIIDEAHMLTNEAFNALLKTLEEPPDHALFVLCTTQPSKIPETISSRCWQIDFARASEKEIVRSLVKVVKGEGLKVKKTDLKLMARVAQGSFRDGVKILEQLAATGKRISSKRVSELLSRGLQGRGVDDWLVLVYQKKTKEALIWLSKAVNEGLEVKQFMIDVVERLREVLLFKLKVDKKGRDIKELEETEVLKELIEVMAQATAEIKGAVIASLPVELAVVEWGEQESRVVKVEARESVESENLNEKKVVVGARLAEKSGKLDIRQVEDKWSEVLKALRPHNHSLEALLRATRPSGFDGKFLVLEVFYKFHKERLEAERYRQLVEEVASDVLSFPVGIRFTLSERAKKTVIQKQPVKKFATMKDDIIETAEEVFGVKVK